MRLLATFFTRCACGHTSRREQRRLGLSCLGKGGGAPLLSLGQDLLRFLLMLDGIGRYEVGNIRLSCKALLEVIGLTHDDKVDMFLAFDGAAVFRPTSRSLAAADFDSRDPPARHYHTFTETYAYLHDHIN